MYVQSFSSLNMCRRQYHVYNITSHTYKLNRDSDVFYVTNYS